MPRCVLLDIVAPAGPKRPALPLVKGPVLLLVLTFLAAAACATNPVTGKRELSMMSEEQEIRIGREQDVQIKKEMGVYSDEELQRYISDIGLRLSRVSERPELPWHYTVVDSPAINAFALPGGYIYVTRGIMPFLDDESQLAGVLGHETGHVTARHANQQYSRSTSAGLGLLLGSIFVPAARPFASLGESGLGVLMLKYGRDDERQADALGVKYASTVGWDPAGVPNMLTTLGRIEEASSSKGVPNWLQTHPAADDRIQRVQDAVRDAEKGAGKFTTDRDGYLKRLVGLVYGDNPDQGVVRDGSFLHAGLRFAIEFPKGWDVNNGQTQVTAKQPGENALILLQEVPRPVGRTIQEIALRSMESAGFRALDGGRTTIHGLEAFIGTYQGTAQDFGRVTLRAAYIVHDRSIFLVAGLASQQIYERVAPVFGTSLGSFRPLTRGEAESIHPNTIALYTVRDGDTWQGIAEHQCKGIIKSSTLAIMNGHAVNDQPRTGERLKIVVAG